MADFALRSSDIEHASNDTGVLDLLKTKTSAAVDISIVNLTDKTSQTTNLSGSVAVNCNQVPKIDMTNSKNATDGSNSAGLSYQEESLSNNNNRDRNFRKSQSALTLTMLPVVSDDNCSTCAQETDDFESDVLKQELKKLQEELRRKEEECLNLTHVQLQTGQEVEELTASLFEEANKMVQDANIKRMTTERLLADANNKIEILQAEVTALKALVLTSTPSKPNPHLNPQIDKSKKAEFRGHRRSTSHHSFVKEIQLPKFNLQEDLPASQKQNQMEECEPEMMKEFCIWRQTPSLNSSSPFLSPVIHDDILPCLKFANTELSQNVYDGIFSNTVSVEPLLSQKMGEYQHCALSEADTVCAYCFKLGDQQTPFAISKMARNRIIAVCDFVTYIRYIMQGLVKSSDKEAFAEVLQLRKKMCLARLGLEE